MTISGLKLKRLGFVSCSCHLSSADWEGGRDCRVSQRRGLIDLEMETKRPNPEHLDRRFHPHFTDEFSKSQREQVI